MLVLNRKVGERIVVGDEVVITVVAVHGHQVRIGIEAPASVAVWREELLGGEAAAWKEAAAPSAVSRKPSRRLRHGDRCPAAVSC